jgi:hypothetical protein
MEGDQINFFICTYHPQNYSTIFSWYLLLELQKDLLKNFTLVNPNLTTNITVHENETKLLYDTQQKSHVYL